MPISSVIENGSDPLAVTAASYQIGIHGIISLDKVAAEALKSREFDRGF
ncbi:MAG: hypothetical protein ACF788_00805 [Novipirellula sp. JB048]